MGTRLYGAVGPAACEELSRYFDRKHPVVFVILNIKWFYSVEKQQ